MANLEKEILKITISPDQLTAKVYCTEQYEENKEIINKYYIEDLLEKHNVSYGIDDTAISKLLSHPTPSEFPLTIAKGKPPQKGEDGKIIYKIDVDSSIEKTEDWNFRDVMKIPSVKSGDEIAEIVPPKKGIDGIGVNNYIIKARPGKPFLMRPGKNVEFNENNQTLYAIQDGQVVVRQNKISVEPIFEVHGDLSMEVGNINFVGTVIIHGDVPTGFVIEAGGDVKIHGIVEAAKVIAGGSIYLYEGFAGLQKGFLQADHNIYMGYMNQGKANAKQSIYVENSILHSECYAEEDVFCKSGNIIGGTITAGRVVEARDIGNRLNIKTKINLIIDEQRIEAEKKLLDQKIELEKTLNNLKVIREKLLSQQNLTDQIKHLIVRQQNSYNQTKEDLRNIDEQICQLEKKPINRSIVLVQNTLYPNTIISFGKYQRLIQKQYDKVQVTFDKKEIKINPYNP